MGREIFGQEFLPYRQKGQRCAALSTIAPIAGIKWSRTSTLRGILMDLHLRGKTVLVTGASRGLGFCTAQVLVREGAHAVICGRNEDSLRSAVDRLGSHARYVVADVSQLDDVKSLAKNVESTEGVLDGVFINAGGPPSGTFEELTEADWERSFQLVLMSAVRLTRELLPLLERSETPSILYDTSTSVKQPTANYILANSLRTAVTGMMRTLAGELGPRGIRVNAVCPGNINTESMKATIESSSDAKRATERIKSSIPLRRIGEPQEFGAVCAFLLSPVASYVHGVLLLVDGGLYGGMM